MGHGAVSPAVSIKNMLVYFHTTSSLFGGRLLALHGAEGDTIINDLKSPLSQAGRGLNPTTFLNGFYDWAKLNSGQVVELGPGEIPNLPARAGVSSYVLDMKYVFTENLPNHLTGIVGNISHLPQSEEPLTRESCDIVYWHSEMFKHLDGYAKIFLHLSDFLEAIILLDQGGLPGILDTVIAEQSSGLTGEGVLRCKALGEELHRNPVGFIQTLRGTNMRNNVAGIYAVLKSGGYFVETDVGEDAVLLLRGFQYCGLPFREVHYVIPEGQNIIWAMALRK